MSTREDQARVATGHAHPAVQDAFRRPAITVPGEPEADNRFVHRHFRSRCASTCRSIRRARSGRKSLAKPWRPTAYPVAPLRSMVPWEPPPAAVPATGDNGHRVAAPCPRRPNAHNSFALPADAGRRWYRNRAPGKTPTRVHKRWLHSGQSRSHGRNELLPHKVASPPRCCRPGGRSLPTPARTCRGRSADSFRPTRAVALAAPSSVRAMRAALRRKPSHNPPPL